MRNEMISNEAQRAELREQGVKQVNHFRLAVMESQGQISVVMKGA